MLLIEPNHSAVPVKESSIRVHSSRGRAVRVLSVVSAVLMGAVNGIATSTTELVHAAVDSDALSRDADTVRIRTLAISALAQDLVDSDILDPLRGTPYQLEVPEIAEIFAAAFTVEDVGTKAHEIHGDLVRYGSKPYGEDIPPFRIDISDERADLADALSDHLVETLEALPDCGILGDADALWSGLESKLGLADDPEVIRDMPRCHPTEIVAEPLRTGFRRGIIAKVTAHDSIDVLPRPSWADDDYATWLAAGRTIRVMPRWTLVASLLLLGTGCVLSLMKGGGAWALTALIAAATALLVAGALMALTWETLDLDTLLLGRTLAPDGDVGDAWRALILEFERSSLAVAAQRSLLWGLATAGLAAGLAAAMKRLAPASRSPS